MGSAQLQSVWLFAIRAKTMLALWPWFSLLRLRFFRALGPCRVCFLKRFPTWFNELSISINPYAVVRSAGLAPFFRLRHNILRSLLNSRINNDFRERGTLLSFVISWMRQHCWLFWQYLRGLWGCWLNWFASLGWATLEKIFQFQVFSSQLLNLVHNNI
jgi:hypothetical protein